MDERKLGAVEFTGFGEHAIDFDMATDIILSRQPMDFHSNGMVFSALDADGSVLLGDAQGDGLSDAGSAAGDRRRESQPHTELLEHDGDRRIGTATLNNGIGEFTASEEARLLTVHRDQIWFSQLACTGRWITRRLGHSVSRRLTEAPPR